jgi:hypothetical protein
MSFPEGRVRLALSITAHEELDTLLAQVRNLRWFCDEPLIVVHLNHAYFAQIEEDAVLRRALRLLEEEHGTIVNPRHFETRWAHMFHAHLSNFRLLTARGEAFTHFVTLSSADLFFRHGAEAHLRGFDASQTSWEPLPLAALGEAPGYWVPKLREDSRFLGLVAARGLSQVMHGPHEGNFYARPLMEAMTRLLEQHVPDWDYDDRYPKEEFFLQTLLQEHPAARLGHSLAHVLVIGSSAARDRQAVAGALDEIGVFDPGGGAPVDRWGREALEGAPSGAPDPLAQRFVLSRIPRAPDHPLRLLLEQAAGAAGARRARSLARRFTPADLLKLDGPGAKAEASQDQAPAPWLLAALHDAPAQELLTPALGRGVRDIELGPCPDAYLPPIEVTQGLRLCAAHLPAPGAKARIGLHPGKLLSFAARGLGKRSAAAFVFVFFEVPLPSDPDALLRLVLAKGSPPPRDVWIEAHGPEGKRSFPLGRGMEAGEDGRTRMYRLPLELLALRGAAQWPVFTLYLSVGLGAGGCRIASIGFAASEA